MIDFILIGTFKFDFEFEGKKKICMKVIVGKKVRAGVLI